MNVKRTKSGIGPQERQMLEMLARGASTREIAHALGYKEGTIRVYLHDLYKKVGVTNKTSAVIWFMEQARAAPRKSSAGAPAVAVAASASLDAPPAGEDFGGMALRTSLYAALGVMHHFLGAHGKLWEVANRLKGEDAGEPALEQRRARSRRLWEALLRGDFTGAKKLADDGDLAALIAGSPTDGVVLGAMLLIGGYSGAATRLVAQLAKRTKGARGATAKEQALLKALRDALEDRSEEAVACLHVLATESGPNAVQRQLAMVALFYTYIAHRDGDRARRTANALWAEAENTRQHLQAMGERPVARDVALPEPSGAARKGVAGYLKAGSLERA